MGALFVFKNLDIFADKKQRVSIRIRQRFNSVSSDTHPCFSNSLPRGWFTLLFIRLQNIHFKL